MVPISLHLEQPGRASGNQDTWMVVPLPIGEPDPVRRLRLITTQTAERKNRARPRVGSGISGTALAQHAFLRLLAHQRLMNTSITNVPGPPVPLYLAGARLLELFPVVSLAGNFRLVVAVLSYAGQLNLTAVADAASCTDVEVFAQGVRTALEELARSVALASS
jgi:diacylglycerol O-acyltransferase / wax synthase